VSSELDIDALRDQLVRSIGKDIALIAGWVGESRKSNYYRVYLTPELEDYLEVPQDAIVHREVPGRAGSGYRLMHLLWIRTDATLEYVGQPASRPVTADLLAQQAILLQRFAKNQRDDFQVQIAQNPTPFQPGAPDVELDASRFALPVLPPAPGPLERGWCWIFPC
jgi:hypothetical protein